MIIGDELAALALTDLNTIRKSFTASLTVRTAFTGGGSLAVGVGVGESGASFEVQKRFTHGFSFHSSYTYSQTISNTESVAAVNDFPETPDRNLERALSRQYACHRYTLALRAPARSRAHGRHNRGSQIPSSDILPG
jgi:hypothetical protein